MLGEFSQLGPQVVLKADVGIVARHLELWARHTGTVYCLGVRHRRTPYRRLWYATGMRKESLGVGVVIFPVGGLLSATRAPHEVPASCGVIFRRSSQRMAQFMFAGVVLERYVFFRDSLVWALGLGLVLALMVMLPWAMASAIQNSNRRYLS